MKLIHRAGTCEDGTCPNIWDIEEAGPEAMVRIRGNRPSVSAVLAGLSPTPAHEADLVLPRRLLFEYVDQVRAGGGSDDT